MADSVVSFLLQNLTRLVEDEHKLLSGVEDKVNSLRNELKFIDIFLKSSEGRRNNDVVKEVVRQIRDVAYNAEDVIDSYIANITKHKSRSFLGKLFHLKEPLMVLHEVDTEINKIKSSIEEIYKSKDRYDIGEGEFRSEELDAAELLRKKRMDVEEEDVVGFVHDSAQVIQQLMESDSRRKVVSIIGMGGLGKTTLARKIYNNTEVRHLFSYRAWGYVSNDYRARELLLSLLKCLLSTAEYNKLFKKRRDEPEVDAMSEEKLKKKLREWLKGKKYLIVLDDIWNTQVWDEVKSAFLDDENGSRILITSRINEVAHYTGTASPYYLPLLKEQESWELFSKKVFGGEACPPDLESVGISIVETCGGLPLAIVVLAGLVAKKERTQREWKRIKEVSWHLTKNKTQVMDILKLSYDSLPQRLKSCFLYFGIYPEDYEIKARELIKLWTAEGFTEAEEGGTEKVVEAEDIADYYLDELVDRCLVQVASRRTDGGVKTCRIHDLLRDLCILESKSEKFLEICTKAKNMDTLSNANTSRRLSFHSQVRSNVSSNKTNQCCTRSLFFFPGESGMTIYPVSFMKKFKLVRLIYGEGYCRLRPSDMKKLIHLRYLKVDVNDVPSYISCLCNLEMLHVWYDGTASSEIWKLKRLRHLYLETSGRAKLPVVAEADSERETNLQTLWLKSMDPQMESLLRKDIFPRLRKLVFNNPNAAQDLRVPSLQHLSNLHCLKIGGFGTEISLNENELPRNLTKITLDATAEKLFLAVKKTLGLLTSLQILKLQSRKYYIQHPFELNIGSGEFPQLQVFQMKSVGVTGWRMEEGAMPRLRHLLIEHCKYLNELPQQLWSLPTLHQVHVLDSSPELVSNLQNVKLKKDCKLFIKTSSDK